MRVGDLDVVGGAVDGDDPPPGLLDERGVVGGLGPVSVGVAKGRRPNACGVCTASKPSGSMSSSCWAGMVSVIGTAQSVASAPPRTAPITRRKSSGRARGRTPSWTTMISALAGTAARPRRTDSDLVAPPATAPSTCGTLAARTTATTPAQTSWWCRSTRRAPTGRPASHSAWSNRTDSLEPSRGAVSPGEGTAM